MHLPSIYQSGQLSHVLLSANRHGGRCVGALVVLLLCRRAVICHLTFCAIQVLALREMELSKLAGTHGGLTQLSDPEFEHLILPRQHLRLCLVECGIVASASQQEVLRQRTETARRGPQGGRRGMAVCGSCVGDSCRGLAREGMRTVEDAVAVWQTCLDVRDCA